MPPEHSPRRVVLKHPKALACCRPAQVNRSVRCGGCAGVVTPGCVVCLCAQLPRVKGRWPPGHLPHCDQCGGLGDTCQRRCHIRAAFTTQVTELHARIIAPPPRLARRQLGALCETGTLRSALQPLLPPRTRRQTRAVMACRPISTPPKARLPDRDPRPLFGPAQRARARRWGIELVVE